MSGTTDAQLPGTASTAVGNYVSAILTLIPFLQVPVFGPGRS